MWETRDREGRLVTLTAERWVHIRDTHPEFQVAPGELLAVVECPARVVQGRTAAERWLYGHGIGPTNYVKVVVHYEGDLGTIKTAFPRRRFP